MKLWAFRDLASNTVRTTSSDPGSILDGAGMKKVQIQAPGGTGLKDFSSNLKSVLQSLNGSMGAEAYVEVDIGGLSIDELGALMTPPEPAAE